MIATSGQTRERPDTRLAVALMLHLDLVSAGAVDVEEAKAQALHAVGAAQ
jgi:hypothetical protein